MLIKEADDKSRRLKLLEDLQQSPWLDAGQKDWLRKKLWRLRTGIQGEKDAAHYIDAHYRDSEHHAVLHDLRIEVDGEVAQIDHLLLSRAFIFLLETKNFNGNLSINAHGEFSVSYADRHEGIPSPLEQSRRHEKVLRKLLERLGIRSVTGGSLEIRHVVLIHPRSIIQRPDSKAFDTSNVIKADSLRTWHDQFIEKDLGLLKTVALAPNLFRSQHTVREWAEKLKRQHRPADPLSLPDFMQPQAPSKAAPAPTPTPQRAAPARAASFPQPAAAPGTDPDLCATCGTALPPKVADYCRSHAAQFGGQLYCLLHQKNQAGAPAARAVARAPRTPAAPPVCATCGATLSPRVADFCRKRPDRFGGQLYCMAHQATAG